MKHPYVMSALCAVLIILVCPMATVDNRRDPQVNCQSAPEVCK